MDRITHLTAKQEALLQVYRQKWIDIARSTQPIDRQKATEAVHNFYAAFAQPEPQVLFFKGVSSALANALAYQLKWRWLLAALEWFNNALAILGYVLCVPLTLLSECGCIVFFFALFKGFIGKFLTIYFLSLLSAGVGLGILIMSGFFNQHIQRWYRLTIRCVSQPSKRQRRSSQALASDRAFQSFQKDSTLSFDRRSFCLGWLQFQVNEIGYKLSPELKHHLWCELVGYQQIGEIGFTYATREWLKFEQWDFTRQQILRQLLSHSRRANGREQVLMEVLVDPGYLMPYLCWLDFCISELGCQHDKPRWQAFYELIQACGWVIPGRNICWVCDRPLRLLLDEQYRLHAEREPAIKFADRFKMYAYHGVELPPRYAIAPRNWKSKWLLRERNAELRRILIQGIGYERILRELKARRLDSWREYILYQITTHRNIEPFVLLTMTCPSTGHIHVIRVPPEMQSAREAVRWVNWDIDSQKFAVET